MKKQLIALGVMAGILLFSMVACQPPEEVDDGKLKGGTVQSSGSDKPQRSLAFAYVIEKKEFEIGENVGIEFFYGTNTTRNIIAQSTYDLPNANEAYKAVLYLISKEGYFTNDDINGNSLEYSTTIVIKEFDEFCSENYPYPIKGVYLNSYKTTLSHDLFVGEYGEIRLIMEMFDESYTGAVFYKIENGKVTLSQFRYVFNSEVKYDESTGILIVDSSQYIKESSP
jgi:hypothetical protein